MVKRFNERPDWTEFDDAWLESYDQANYGSGLSSRVLRATHSLIEQNAGLEASYPTVLEIGAGTMAHFPTVRHGFERYIATDGNPKVVDWLGKQNWEPRVEIMQIAGCNLPFEDGSVDRVIATHVLEHVPDPVAALTEWTRVLKPGGVLSLILPSDPGMAWRFGRMLGPRRRAEAAGLPYDYYMAIEHKNSIFGLKHVIRFHYPKRHERWWPLKLPIPDLNLVFAVNCFV